MKIYVSTEGNDKNPGTAELPLKTIQAAIEIVRNNKKGMQQDIDVMLHGGIYYVNEPIKFTSEDSGENGYRILYRAIPGEKVIISGGKKVTGWERAAETGIKNMWKAYLPGLENTRHLYVDGKRAERARSEVKETHGWDILNDPDMQFHSLIGEIETYMGTFEIYEGYKTAKKEMVAWRNPKDIEFVFDVGWTHSICPVDEIVETEDGAFIKMRMPCFKYCQMKGVVRVGSPNYIENAFELLDEPGEWYFDRSAHTLFYIANSDDEIETSEFIIPVADCLLLIDGSIENPVRNLTFEGIEFCYTTWLEPSINGHAESQANLSIDLEKYPLFHSSFVKPKGAIQLNAAEYIVFTGCTFKAMGSTAMDVQKGSSSNIIRGCEFADISGSGIQLGGFTLEDAHPKDSREIVKANKILNNYFHDIGIEYKGSIPILAGYVQKTLIAHNEICRASYSGISVGWGWGYWDEFADERLVYKPPKDYPRFNEPTVASENRIEYNHVHHVLQKLHDGAGIYTLSMQAGSVIRGNHIHDNGGFTGERYEEGILVGNSQTFSDELMKRITLMKGFPGGIYLDEASGGFEVVENIVYNVVVPFNYHDLGMNGRYFTNQIHSNYFHIDPEHPMYPQGLVQKAGLEPEFMYLLHNTGC